jgi:hypothetical protein
MDDVSAMGVLGRGEGRRRRSASQLSVLRYSMGIKEAGMATKIPVGKTIARGYRFAFSNIINNLGVIWIPVAIMWAYSFFLFRPYMMQLASGDPQLIRRALPSLFLYLPVFFILISCQIAGLTKEALGLRSGNAFLQFPFGLPAWRLMASYLFSMIVTYIAVLIVMTISIVVLGLAASAASGDAVTRVLGMVTKLVMLGVFCAFIYVGLRLSFLLAPVCIAEHRITVIRSWRLTRGNFWRIIAMLLAVLLPLLIVECGYLYAFYGTNLIPPIGQPMTPEAMAEFHQQQLILIASKRMQSYWYLTYPLGLLFALVMYGSFAGLSAFAYEEVVAFDLGEPRGWFARWVSRSLGKRTAAPE